MSIEANTVERYLYATIKLSSLAYLMDPRLNIYDKKYNISKRF